MSPLYKYEAINDMGKKHTGKLDADDESHLGKKLSYAGLYLIKATDLTPKKRERRAPDDLFWCPACSRPVAHWKPFNWLLFLLLILTGIGWAFYIIYHIFQSPHCPICRSPTRREA